METHSEDEKDNDNMSDISGTRKSNFKTKYQTKKNINDTLKSIGSLTADGDKPNVNLVSASTTAEKGKPEKSLDKKKNQKMKIYIYLQ